jgi:vacuolar protein-sorting-associated protein 4
MDWQKIYGNIKYDLDRITHKFKDADTVEERKGHINNFIKTLNYLDNVLKGSVPSLYKNTLNNLLILSKDELKMMEQDIDNLPQKITDGQGGGKKKSGGGGGDPDDDKMDNNILETIVGDKPNVKWTDIAGLHEAKKSLHEALIMPIKYPNFFVGNVKPWRGILLYGPPGTGKTFIAKACATECESTFFSVSSSDLMSKYVGESEKMIKTLFKVANEKAPSIIFIDEIDSMCGNRSDGENEASRRVKTEFLVQMQGVGSNNEKVLVLGATNLPWALDPAVRRRFEKRIYIPLPDEEARMYLLRTKLKGLDENLTDEDLKFVASKTEGFSGSDLEVLAKDVAMEPLRFAQSTNKFKKVNVDGKTKYMPIQNGNADFVGSVYDLPSHSLVLPPLTKQDLLKTLEKSKPSVSDADLNDFVKWSKEFGSE